MGIQRSRSSEKILSTRLMWNNDDSDKTGYGINKLSKSQLCTPVVTTSKGYDSNFEALSNRVEFLEQTIAEIEKKFEY